MTSTKTDRESIIEAAAELLEECCLEHQRYRCGPCDKIVNLIKAKLYASPEAIEAARQGEAKDEFTKRFLLRITSDSR